MIEHEDENAKMHGFEVWKPMKQYDELEGSEETPTELDDREDYSSDCHYRLQLGHRLGRRHTPVPG